MPFRVTKEAAEQVENDINAMREEIDKVLVGQQKSLSSVFRALITNKHVLLEGVPGIGKTLLLRSLAKTSGCDTSRIQFTVDLLPTDITGIETYNEKKGFYVVKGPIFTNFLLADEVNRSPPKTHSAMLQAMQEKQVTIAKKTYSLPKPFFVMATQNPLEAEGVYNLPQAELDRFLFKIKMGYPEKDEEKTILHKNISTKKFEDYNIKQIIKPERIIDMSSLVNKVYVSNELENYIVNIVRATRQPKDYNITKGQYISVGASPRASIGIFISSKADALIHGNNYITPQNIKDVAYDILRHRIILNYEGEAAGITTEEIIKETLQKVPVP